MEDNIKKPEPLSIRINSIKKRKREIIIVVESDIYTDDVFCVTPFYDEGDDKNHLQHMKFNVYVEEVGGKVSATVNFSSEYHSTTGYSQLHGGIGSYYKERKDSVLAWFLNTKQEYFNKIHQDSLLKIWESDIDFCHQLKEIAKKRELEFKKEILREAKEKYLKASKEFENALNNLTI